MNYDILMICDDEVIKILLGVILEEEGYTVYNVNNGEEGLSSFLSTSPRLVIIRASPIETLVDEIEVCKKIRSQMSYNSLPILMISPRKEIAIDCGVTKWFDIVFDVNEVISTVKNLLR